MAVLSRGVSRPAEVLYENVSGWLSGLEASQVIVELSPRFTVAGFGVQVMVGTVETAAGGGGGGGGSNISTPSPTLMSSRENVMMPVELLGLTLKTIRFTSERRGRSCILEDGVFSTAWGSS